MGNYTSKLLLHNSNQENSSEVTENVEQSNVVKDCNSITPPTMRKKLIDPRSITAEVARTPIEVNNTTSKNIKVTVSAIPKHLQMKPYLETYFGTAVSPLTSNRYLDSTLSNVDQPGTPTLVEDLTSCTTPTNTLKNKKVLSSANLGYYTTLGLDPRSPSVDFDRTPIHIPKINRNQKSKSNDNLQEHNETDNCPKFLYCETTSFHTPEILALVDETFEALKCSQLNKSDSTDSADKPELDITDDINHVNNEHGDSDNACNNKSLQNENAMINTIKIWRDSMLLEDLDQSETECSDQESSEQKFPRLPKEEIEVIFDDDDSIKESTPIPDPPRNESDSKNVHDALENKKKVKASATVKNGKIFTSYNSNVNDISMKRTPLRNRCNNAQLDTILMKSPQHVLHNKNLNAIIQQENTPPHKRCHAKSKVKGIQWDVNSTVII